MNHATEINHAPEVSSHRINHTGLVSVLVLLLLTLIGWFGRALVEDEMKESLAHQLQVTLQSNVAALRLWMDKQKSTAAVWAAQPAVRRQILAQMTSSTRDSSAQGLLRSEALPPLRQVLAPVCKEYSYPDFVVIDSTGLQVAALLDQPVGKRTLAQRSDFVARALRGETVVSHPFIADTELPDQQGLLRSNLPTMFTASPVRDEAGKIVAVLAFRIRPEIEFTRVLKVSHFGETGETYAFDANGLMLSDSRFNDHLRTIGLLSDSAEIHAILNIEIRDPGGNLLEGFQPRVPREKQPLTRMAARATAGQSGMDVEGYRDYRGVPVVGAWSWLDEYQFGVTTEIDVAEAYRPLSTLRNLFLTLFGLLALAAGMVLFFRRRQIRSENERQRYLKALRESVAYTHAVVDHAVEGIITIDEHGTVLSFNRACEDIFGYAASEVIGQSVNRLIPEPYGSHHDQYIQNYLRTGKRRVIGISREVVGLRKNGEVFPMELAVSEVQRDNRRTFVGIVRDISERKRAEQALRESEEKFRHIINAAGDAIIAIDEQGVILEFNRAAEQMFGFTKAELLEKSLTAIIPERFREAHRAALQRFLATGQRHLPSWQNLELPGLTKEGREIPLELSFSLFESGDKKFITGILRDISERKRAEAALRASQQKYEELVNSIDGIVWEADARTFQFTFVSQQAERLLGYPSARWLSEPTFWKDHLHPEDREWAVNFCATATAEKRQHEFEYRMLAADGRIVWLKDYVTVVVENDQPCLLRGVMVDITARRGAEEQLRKLSQAVEQSPASVVITDTRGCIEYVNPRFTAVTGYTPEETKGQNPRILKSGKQPPELYKQLWETISSGGEWRGELLNKKKNGELYWEYASISPIRNQQGEITHFLAVKEDITERKRMEEELQRAREAAEAANRAKSEFLANMSHEIRTPLNSIIGMTELALETELNAEQRDYLQVLSSSSETLLSLINDILDFSKIEAGQLALESISFNLKELVEGVAEMLSVRAHKKGLELLCDLEPDLPTWVVGDPTRVRQILMNLMGNAIKFTEQGEVALEVRGGDRERGREGEGVTLHFAVRDTGIGISPEHRNRLFQKFIQADSSTTRKHGGTGLGLSISKALVELMGGRIWLESEMGKGSTFHFTLLLVIAEGKELAEYEERDFSKLKVLVVDDNASNRLIVEKTLSAWGFQVQTAASGSQALALLANAQTPYHLVILDYEMPEMDGVEVVRAIRKQPPWQGLKILMLSSWDGLDKALLTKLGVAEVFTKPVKQSQLFNLVLRLVGGEKEVQVVDTVSPAPMGQPEGRGQRILLVEDNRANQNLATKILQKAGYRVDIAENGIQAVQAAQGFHYDLILMDIQMPEMDGFAATREIRAREKAQKEERVPIIALTAHVLEGYREKCLAHDMDDYLTKPLKKHLLLQTVAGWIDTRPTILVVDDSVDNRHLIKNYLKKEAQYRLLFARNGEEAVAEFRRRTISLILMDMEMPVLDGYTAAAQIRQMEDGAAVPIVALTAHQGKREIDRCMAAGCTAYMSKPIRKRELIKMIQEMLAASQDEPAWVKVVEVEGSGRRSANLQSCNAEA